MKRHIWSRETAVSPVVAVILLVAVTVTLSAVIGGFALNLGQSATGDASQQQSLGVSTTQTDGQFTATVVTGEADELSLRVNGSAVETITNPSAGDTVSANVTTGDRVTVVTVRDGTKQVATSVTAEGSASASSTLTTGLVSHWTMDSSDVSGGTLIDTIGSNNGTIYGAQTGVTGVEKEALAFDGTDNVTVPDNTSLQVKNVTVSAWVYWDGSTPEMYDPNVLTKLMYSLRVNSVNNPSPTFEFYLNVSGTRYYLNSPNSTPTNAWTHYVGTYDGETMRLYQNGSLVNETTAPSGPLATSNHDLMLGQDQNGDNAFSGRIDEARVYNRSLNKSEVQDLYDATK